jgi:hypothetical protein
MPMMIMKLTALLSGVMMTNDYMWKIKHIPTIGYAL